MRSECLPVWCLQRESQKEKVSENGGGTRRCNALPCVWLLLSRRLLSVLGWAGAGGQRVTRGGRWWWWWCSFDITGWMANQQYEVTEIEDMDTWNAVVKKGNEDLNIIDVYAKWCGPCMCEFARTRHRLANRTAIHARTTVPRSSSCR